LEIIIASTTFTNGRVALRDDLIFGVVVLAENGWLPITELAADHIEYVLALLSNNPTCPQRFYDALRKQLNECKEHCGICGATVVDPCTHVQDTPVRKGSKRLTHLPKDWSTSCANSSD
jgi:hypothetical protein